MTYLLFKCQYFHNKERIEGVVLVVYVYVHVFMCPQKKFWGNNSTVIVIEK